MELKRNIILPDTAESFPYQRPSGGGGDKRLPDRMRREHAAALRQELKNIESLDTAAETRGGIYLRFNSSPGYEIDPDTFDNAPSKVQLVGVSHAGADDSQVMSATVFVPEKKRDFFEKKIAVYADESKATKNGNPRNKPLVESIDGIVAVSVHDFWTGNDDEYPEKVAKWCEIWFSTEHLSAERMFGSFKMLCRDRQIDASDDYLEFPECLVVLARLNADELKIVYDNISPIIEIRPLAEPNDAYVDSEPGFQRELTEELRRRVLPADNEVSVCILDTGINASHPLLEAAIHETEDSVLAAEDSWTPTDEVGHGTEMAGVAIYNDLRHALDSFGVIKLYGNLESVKILPKSNDNPAHLYGSITSDAMMNIEIEHPNRARAYCMAVTDNCDQLDGIPSSWSAQLDGLAAGVDSGDKHRRLCLVSAGNVDKNDFHDLRYPDLNLVSSVQDPAQAWNVLTVGAYSDSVTICDPRFKGYSAMAPKGGLCPYGRTSCSWDRAWPIKPEICCEGGNLAGDAYTNCMDSDEMARLTTSHELSKRYFTTTRATSAATAQASWMASRILAAYPDIWPETVRALLVHSARWTKAMEDQFLPEGSAHSKRDYWNLLRSCGWGVPNLDYALGCLDNRANLVIQGTIQPFDEKGSAREMRVHELPWPREELLRLGEADAQLRVTLSYFIEPNPGNRGWGNKFRYQSCGLRFQMIDRRQSYEDFLKSVSAKMRRDKGDNGGESGASDWVLGADNRDMGSIHSDFKNLSAADLADARYIAVFPTKGWWATRKALGKRENKIRYALVVTIDTPTVDSRLYDEIMTQVKVSVVNTVQVQ